jgi:hypothetical protein
MNTPVYEITVSTYQNPVTATETLFWCVSQSVTPESRTSRGEQWRGAMCEYPEFQIFEFRHVRDSTAPTSHERLQKERGHFVSSHASTPVCKRCSGDRLDCSYDCTTRPSTTTDYVIVCRQTTKTTTTTTLTWFFQDEDSHHGYRPPSSSSTLSSSSTTTKTTTTRRGSVVGVGVSPVCHVGVPHRPRTTGH